MLLQILIHELTIGFTLVENLVNQAEAKTTRSARLALISNCLLITFYMNKLKAPALCKGTKTLKNKTLPKQIAR